MTLGLSCHDSRTVCRESVCLHSLFDLCRHVDQASLKLSQTKNKFDDDKRKLKQQLTSSTMVSETLFSNLPM